MLNVPAVCSCGLVFPSGIVLGGNVINLTLKGNKSRCPRCGNFADIPDAVLNSYDGAVEVLQSSTYSESQITKFFSILQKTYSDLQDNKPVSLSDTVESLEDNIPFLAALLPSLSNKAELYTFIGLLLQCLSMLIGNEPQTVNNFNGPVIINNYASPELQVDRNCIPSKPKQNISGMCICGSGLLSSLCCSNPTAKNYL